jgi:signal transduction histidine kinase
MDYNNVVLKKKKSIDSKIKLLETVREPSKRIDLLRDIIKISRYHKPNLAREFAEELLDLGLQQRDEEIFGFACNVFAIVEIQKGDYRKAKLYCLQALDALSDKSEEFIITCKNLAEILTSQGEYDSAHSYLLSSKETQSFLNINDYEPFTNAQIAKILYRKGKYEEAFDICINNFRNYQNFSRLDGWEAMTYYVIGLIYAAQMDFQKSLSNYLKSVEIWEKLENPYQITGLYLNIGGSYLYQTDLESAEQYFIKALDVDKEHGGNTKMQSLIYHNLAIINSRNGNKSKSKSYYDTALRLCKMIHDKLGEMQILHNMAAMLGDENPEAIELYFNSLEIAKEIKDSRFIMYNNLGLSNAYAAQKDYKNAYEYKCVAQELEKELFGIEKAREIRKIEQQYQYEWQAKELQILESRNSELKDFIEKATQKIRKPLKMMRKISRVLIQDFSDELSETAQGYLSEISKYTHYLSEIMKSLENYSSLEIRMDDSVRADMNEALFAAIDNLKLKISESNAQVIASVLGIINCRPDIMTLLFQNIIENAIKYRSKAAPIIHVEIDENFNETIISIKDNGIGIPQKDTERVLEVFERVQEKNYDGDGVGLAVCRKIMTALHGEIWIESSLGQGTTVFLKFPK